VPFGASDIAGGGQRPWLLGATSSHRRSAYLLMVACSRMLWVPVSTQMVLCTMRSMIASAWTPEPSRWCQSFLAYWPQNTPPADPSEANIHGAILRREGLYSSHIIEWRKAAQAGAAAGLGPAGRNRSERQRDREVEQLRARAEKAEAELARPRAALDLMGKAHALLETLPESAEAPAPQKR